MIRNLRCTVAIDSVLANSKTQNAFLFTVNAIFRLDYPLAVEPGSTPRPLVQKKLGEILYLLICSFLPCLSWSLRSRVRKSRRDLWITLYNFLINHFCISLKEWYTKASTVWLLTHISLHQKSTKFPKLYSHYSKLICLSSILFKFNSSLINIHDTSH